MSDQAPPFNAAAYLQKIRSKGGSSDYLTVAVRLLWLRTEFPDAEIVTEHVHLDEQSAVFRCRIVKERTVEQDVVQERGVATGYGSETLGDFQDFLEKAETRAIGRALNHLGYSTEAADPEGALPVDQPAVAPHRGQPAPYSGRPPAEVPPESIAGDPTTWTGKLAWWRNQIDAAASADQLLAVHDTLAAEEKPPQMAIDYLDLRREALGLPPFVKESR